jgi:molecular chaperone DnaJ
MIYNMIFPLLMALLSVSSTLGFSISGARISLIKSSGSRLTVRGIQQPSFNSKSRKQIVELFMSSKDSDTNPFYKGQDAYQILEVPRGADKKEIKSAYRKAVSTWHPDKFPDDEKKKAEGNLRMEKINRAWYCLGDDDRKRRYDQFGEQGVGSSASSEEQIKAAGSPMGGGFGGQGRGVDQSDVSDIFDAFFSGVSGRGGGGAQQRQRNANAPIAGTNMSYTWLVVARTYCKTMLLNRPTLHTANN